MLRNWTYSFTSPEARIIGPYFLIVRHSPGQQTNHFESIIKTHAGEKSSTWCCISGEYKTWMNTIREWNWSNSSVWWICNHLKNKDLYQSVIGGKGARSPCVYNKRRFTRWSITFIPKLIIRAIMRSIMKLALACLMSTTGNIWESSVPVDQRYRLHVI